MNLRLTAFVGIFTAGFFIIGFALLFIINPQTYEELNNLSLTSYNINGMNARFWAASVYVTTGSLNIFFCIRIVNDGPKRSSSLIGKIILLISGATWLSFGVIAYDPTVPIANHLLLIRLIILLMSSFVGLLLVGLEYHRVAQDKFLRWCTLSSASIIGLLSILSIFVYEDHTWLRTNVSITIYFVWPAVFGLRTLLRQD